MSMRTAEDPKGPILSLPGEIQQEIIDLLSADGASTDLRSLGRTCKFYNNLLVPQLLSSVVLCNTERSGSSLQAIAAGENARYVMCLHYRGVIPCDEIAEQPPRKMPFPPSVRSTLSNLHRLPMLKSVVIEFPFDGDSDGFWNLSDFPENGETPDEVRKGEASSALRFLMANIFSALCENTQPTFEHLDLRQLACVAVSIFETDSWRAFLGQLKSFTLSLRGWVNAGGWTMNCITCYSVFVRQMNKWFFDHLRSVRRFVLEAPKFGPLGGQPSLFDPMRVPLPLRRDQMPLLQSLQIRYLMVCKELCEFLVAHANTLQDVGMCDCFAGEIDTGREHPKWLEDGVSPIDWSIFLHAFSEEIPKKLQKFEITFSEDEWWEEETNLQKDDQVEDDKVRQILSDDPQAIFLPYVIVNNRYGTLSSKSWETRQRLLEGSDLSAYKRLTGIARENSAKSRSFAARSSIFEGRKERVWHGKEDPMDAGMDAHSVPVSPL